MKENFLNQGHSPSIVLLAVLSMAEDTPVSGKSFSEKIARLTNGNWRISPGHVYPLLRLMEKKRFLKCRIGSCSKSGRGRRELVYSITKKGKEFLSKARKESKTHVEKMMSRIVPISLFVCFKRENTEFIELAKNACHKFSERLWKAAELEEEKGIKQLKGLLETI